MLHRILSVLDSPRRHLVFLVSLLVLVFALTGLVAHRAIEADRSRTEAVAGVLERGLQRALQSWEGAYYETVATTMNEIGHFDVVSLESEAEPRPEAAYRRINGIDQCEGCLSGIWVYDIATGRIIADVGTYDAGIIGEVRDTLRARIVGNPLMSPYSVGAIYHHVTRDTAAFTFAYGRLSDDEQRITRIVGFAFRPEYFQRILRETFVASQRLTGAATLVERVDTLYAMSAFVAGTQVAGDTLAQEVMQPRYPHAGITLGILLRRDRLTAFGSPTQRLVVLGLVVLIGGLLVLAAFQVRREAMLMRLRADFVSSVSHELRTPLAQIRMFTETLLLGRTRTDIERQRSLEIIEQEARRLSHLVENVLLFSKTDGGRRPKIAPEPTDFAGDIRRAVDSFSLLSRAREAEIRAELQENITVQVDRGALRQILVNLIDNALKYGPNGQRITVGAALFDDSARMWVDDEGPGIPEEMRERVFESFYRLPREMQARVAGSGIGLAVVRELARLHGGRVWAEDAPGGGARIVVEFPDAYLRSGAAAGSLAAAS